MSFNKVVILSGITLLAGQSLGVAASPSEELVLSKQNSTSDGWMQTITATVTNTSQLFYKSAEVDVKFTRGLALNSPTVSTAVITTRNIKPGGIWNIKYAVPASVFHGNDDWGFTITRVLGVRNGSVHISYRSSIDDRPFLFLNQSMLHGSMTSRIDLFGAVSDYQLFSTINIKSAIKAGADVNVQNDKGNTPLIKAVIEAEPAVVRILLEAKADPNIENFDGSSALDYATLDLPNDTAKKATILSDLQKVGAVKGSGYKAMFSPDRKLFLKVQRFGATSDTAGIHIIEGIVANLTSQTLSYVEVNANFLNAEEVVDSGLSNIQNLGPHETWHFKITTLTKDTDSYKLTKLEGH